MASKRNDDDIVSDLKEVCENFIFELEEIEKERDEKLQAIIRRIEQRNLKKIKNDINKLK